jgi:GMP synthase (glutamine-hydrolysing)
MPPRIALLDASHGNPDTPRNFRRELDGDVRRFSVVDRELPNRGNIDAFVISGSRASVYWNEPWIDETRQWVQAAIDDGLPALGICWGHQLLADALGGTVEAMGEHELGYRTVRHTGADIFDGVPSEFTVFTTHSDAVTELPDGAELIAENDHGIHGFKHGRVHGIQAHPEYDPQTAESVVRAKDHLSDERIESVCSGITEEAHAASMDAKAIFGNFCRTVSATRTSALD